MSQIDVVSPEADSKPVCCAKCGHEIRKNGEFCSKCGAKQPAPAKLCRSCGFSLLDDDSFCPACGAARNSEGPKRTVYCRSCGAAIMRAAEFCPKCGGKQHISADPPATHRKKQNGAIIVLSVLSSVTCIFLSFLEWIELPSLFGFGGTTTVFRIVEWIGNLHEMFGQYDEDGILTLVYMFGIVVIGSIIISVIAYVVNIIHIVGQSGKAVSSGRVAVWFLATAFTLLLFAILLINLYLSEETQGVITSVIGLTPVAYIAMGLAIVNYFGFVKNCVSRDEPERKNGESTVKD